MKEIEEFHGTVTAMCWSDTAHRLFVGSDNGLVMAFSIKFSVSLKNLSLFFVCYSLLSFIFSCALSFKPFRDFPN